MTDQTILHLAPTPSPLILIIAWSRRRTSRFPRILEDGARELTTYRGHSHGVWSVAFAPDG